MQQISEEQKVLETAKKIMDLSRTSASFKMRFLSNAITYLRTQESQYPLAVDGQLIYYDPLYVIQAYRTDTSFLDYAFLHMTIHCLFQHIFISKPVDHKYWDMACDIHAFHIISLAKNDSLFHSDASRLAEEKQALSKIRADLKFFSAEHIMEWLLQHRSSFDSFFSKGLFSVDVHDLWYHDEPLQGQQGQQSDSDDSDNQDDNNSGSNGQDNQEDESNSPDNQEDNQNPDEADSNNQPNHNQSMSRKMLSEIWQNMAQRAQTGIETGLLQGNDAGALVDELQEVTREKISYADFLRKFSVLTEQIELNLDEFDYSFYTYGLNLYGNIPLIEPLEYKDTKRIHDFVVAIDTSGSTYGDLVKKFLSKTFSILSEKNTFDSHVCIHIIQCDTRIQEDIRIDSMVDLNRYMRNFRIKGGGGTDFRPLFEYVNKLVESKEFTDLRGLIYFTDGYGSFPERMPAYDTAFVFVDDNHCSLSRVPDWIIPVILDKDEFKESQS